MGNPFFSIFSAAIRLETPDSAHVFGFQKSSKAKFGSKDPVRPKFGSSSHKKAEELEPALTPGKTGGESGFSTSSAAIRLEKPDSPPVVGCQQSSKIKLGSKGPDRPKFGSKSRQKPKELETALRPGKQAGNPDFQALAAEKVKKTF